LQLVEIRGYDKLMHMKFNFYVVAAFLFLALAARAQTTAFTYQGQLINSNAPATGSYDFRFKIYDANNSVVAGPLTNAPVGVMNGLFTVTLNFGAGVFDGSTRSLEIGVRSQGDTNAYIVLSPRQTLTSVPYAIQALNASNAVVLTAPLPATNLAGTIPNSLLSPNVAVLTNNVNFSGGVTATNFTGNGYGLLNVPATSLIGTIPDARLSANVAMLNANANFSGSVTGVLFTGSGHGLTNVPGAFFWVVVSGTNVQAQPNVGYICTNDMNPVTIALPPSLSVGDTFRVAGVGGAGWIIAQTNSQTILAGNLSDSIGASWTARDSSRVWTAVASSADGTKLVATVKGGLIYTSTNSGVTWMPQSGSGSGGRNWSSVASSADGTRLVAGVGDIVSLTGNLWTSVDSGVSWTLRDSARQWVSVASSSDGTRLVAANYTGSASPGIYDSVNSGTNWVLHTSGAGSFAYAVASSADGIKLVATVYSAQIVTSTNAGTNWVTRDSNRNWTALASSADGSQLIAAVSSGQLYISFDSGTTWTANPSISGTWTSVASSADGSRLVAVASSGSVYTSNDSGTTWAQRMDLPAASWTGVACSADGSKLVLVANGNQIYTSSQGSTSTGTAGYLRGARLTAIELEYVGNGIFIPLSHEGTIRAY
jgi:hypothetical protein